MDDELKQALERIRLCDEEEAAELAELMDRLALWAGIFADAMLRTNARQHLRRGIIRYARQVKTPPAENDGTIDGESQERRSQSHGKKEKTGFRGNF